MKKTAVITGCNRGAGRGIMESLVNDGYFVYGLNRTKIIDYENSNYKEIICDTSNVEDVQNAANEIQESIDVLILNAGIRHFGKIGELSIEEFSNSIDINLKGPFYILTSFIKKVKECKGTVIFIGSHAGRYPFEQGAAYCSSKRGIEALSECLMEEVRHEGVKVIHLSLGAIKNRNHGYYEEWKLKPEEIGNTIVELLKIPDNVLLTDINMRPISPKQLPFDSIELLQYK